jgi:hypothetical protein
MIGCLRRELLDRTLIANEQHLRRVAAATRLTQREVRGLTLANLRERFPPLNTDYRRQRPDVLRGGAQAGAGGWFVTASRYCPRCLAGDGSPIQAAHGGAWNKYWRLRVAFICPVHHQLLRHACPRCDRAPYQTPGTSKASPYSAIALHPAQCRTKIAHDPHGASHTQCGSRLDQDIAGAASLAASTTQGLLRVQHTIFAHLGLCPADSAPVVADPMTWFHDLQLLVGLIRASWPAAASVAPDWIDLDAIHNHIDRHDHDAARARHAGKKTTDTVVHAGLPGDARTSASLLALAGIVLTGRGDSPDLTHLELFCSAADDRPA